MHRNFPEAGPETTNLRYGIETILLQNGFDATPAVICELEDYFQRIVRSSTLNGLSTNLENELDMSALFCNSEV